MLKHKALLCAQMGYATDVLVQTTTEHLEQLPEKLRHDMNLFVISQPSKLAISAVRLLFRKVET